MLTIAGKSSSLCFKCKVTQVSWFNIPCSQKTNKGFIIPVGNNCLLLTINNKQTCVSKETMTVGSKVFAKN